jgi:serine/threonine protein kinase
MEKHPGGAQFCAPEAHLTQSYSYPADVYSYSMLLWCIFEGRDRPFGTMQATEVAEMVGPGGKRPILAKTPPSLRGFLKACWDSEPDRRPTFEMIVQQIVHGEVGIPGVDCRSLAYLLESIQHQQSAVRRSRATAVLH